MSAAAASAAFRAEAAVIGAGVVGLAAARALALRGREVVILERAERIGSGTSSRNSEVIHAGIYYPPGSLKAELCVKGRDMLYDFCSSHGVACRRVGKIIVATDPSQVENELRTIEERAAANGVVDLRRLTPEDVASSFEPEVVCHGALLSPSTGVVDSHGFMEALLGEAEENGAALALGSPVEGAGAARGGGIMLRAGGMDLVCESVVNCAGLFADKVASLILEGRTVDQVESEGKKAADRGEEDSEGRQKGSAPGSAKSQGGPPPVRRRQYFAKGNYFRLEGQKPRFRHLVYPVPERAGGLGVHVTIDLGGNVRFGPDVEWVDPSASDPDGIDLAVDGRRADVFYDRVRTYWPRLEDGALAPDYAGIRPKLGHPDVAGSPAASSDFAIEGPRDHGVPGLVNLLGIESPGLTASMAIAEKVADMVNNPTSTC